MLKDHPKWRKFQAEEDAADEQKKKKRDANKKASRPEGTKKAKTAAADRKLIESLVNGANEEAKKSKTGYMQKVSDSLDLLSKGKKVLITFNVLCFLICVPHCSILLHVQQRYQRRCMCC